MSARPVLLLCAGGLVCLAAAGYFLADGVSPASAPGGGAAGTSAAAPRAVPAGSKEYRNLAYSISLLYPEELAVREYDEGGGAATITLQDAGTLQGFQIFIVPYGEPQVTAERFARDVPSGIMQSPLDITVGGVAARSFYSTNALLGDTAEIWFIYEGYLYEVTAPKSQAEWLSGIMATWQFI